MKCHLKKKLLNSFFVVVLGQILHTDIVYLHSGQGFREAEKIKRLLLQFRYAEETYYSYSLNIMKNVCCIDTGLWVESKYSEF